MEIKGQAAIVTGGASGLGAATARALAASGARVAIVDVNEKAAAEVAADVKGVGVACDVATFIRSDCQGTISAERRTIGRFQGCVEERLVGHCR